MRTGKFGQGIPPAGRANVDAGHRRPPVWALLLAAGLAALWPAAAAGQVCQIPLFIQKGDVDANVMILLDNSASMNEVIAHDAYDPAVAYPGDFIAASYYLIFLSGDYTINGRTAYLTSAPNGQPGRYLGNYLNWIFWIASLEEREALPQETKLEVAATVTKAFIDQATDIFIGLAVFNYDNGATILAECGASPADLHTAIDGIAGTAYTPLGEAMEDLLDYFRRTDDAAPIQYDCQRSFIIAITDGYPTMDRDVSAYLWDADRDGNDPGDCTSVGAPYDNSMNCSDHVDDVAYWMRHNDLIDWLGDVGETWEEGQTVVTYAIGFNVDSPLLAETAFNGDGLYLTATNAAELWDSLETVMVNIRLRVAAGAAVAVVSSESSDADYIYRGKFNPAEWMGFVECFELPYKDKEQPQWEAGWELFQRSASSRVIYTALGDQVISLETSNADALYAAMQVPDPATAAEVITWTRGTDLEGYRDRKNDWKLGDIVHSAPVAVGAPSFFTQDMTLQDFVNAYADREKVIYVGANDGMLHAFDAEDGSELWAFVPPYVLPQLKDLADKAYCHTYTVDLTPGVIDAKVDGAWRTVLVSGTGEGASQYFALDITSPTSPEFLWESSLPDSLPFESDVEFARVAGQDVILLGSGLDATGGQAKLYVLDLDDGSLLATKTLSSAPGTRNKATGASAVDLDFDGEADIAYVGDMLGEVYRVAFNGTLSSGSWSMSKLYSGTQPVTAQPKAAYGEAGRIHVYFGTGAYLQEPDILTTALQTFICVFDNHDGSENPILVDQTDGDEDIGTAEGWYLRLIAKKGERVVMPAAIAAGMVYFTSFAPNSEPCRSGGESFFYSVTYDEGKAPMIEDERGQAMTRFRGGGIASRPVLDIVNGTVIVQNSNQTITIVDIGIEYSPLTVKSWQEDFDEAIQAVEEIDGDGQDTGEQD